ncbi:cell wall hydrolase [Alicyclobacillus cycloheptanicus]|uniref:Spore germination cell wall hydrolase CwlJ-like protein n=1 Tax=Alicyclobacillus cycloheptanicus TaxID=1457 RepID=A0ABT9XEI4_9BACL|nr:cell wall hydrolase [Alicyclobacillus cycloheptanicus]MDQ0188711.1 spore germination cell wall hydrolase CwlJ-like protein [Alicyclobacillus cycloheptanicus]WDM00621.1 cell wall hydrolase [Alicyclobacillus cycloheptanicus]
MSRFSSITISAAAAAAAMALGAVPASAETISAHTVTVQPNQTLWKIARASHVPVASLEVANPSVQPLNLLVGTEVRVPSIIKHDVQPGDTLWKLAKQYNVSLSDLEAANPTLNPMVLWVGSVVYILAQTPAASAPAASSTASSASTASGQASALAQSRASAGTASTSTDTSSSLASQNLYWMAHVINAEAGGESEQAQIAVGDVILHRLQSGSYGSTVKDVVFQISDGHYQFTSVMDGYIYTTPTASSWQAAQQVLDDGTDLVPGALVFYDPAQTPAGSWVWNQPTITQIGSLVFAK